MVAKHIARQVFFTQAFLVHFQRKSNMMEKRPFTITLDVTLLAANSKEALEKAVKLAEFLQENLTIADWQIEKLRELLPMCNA